MVLRLARAVTVRMEIVRMAEIVVAAAEDPAVAAVDVADAVEDPAVVDEIAVAADRAEEDTRSLSALSRQLDCFCRSWSLWFQLFCQMSSNSKTLLLVILFSSLAKNRLTCAPVELPDVCARW